MAPWTKVRTDKRNMDLIIVLSSGSEADLVLYVYKIVNVDWTDRIDLNYIFILSPPCYWAEHHC